MAHHVRMTDEPEQPTDEGPSDAEVLEIALDPDLRDLAGIRATERQTAFVTSDEVDTLGSLTDTEIYEGELEAGVNDDLPTESPDDNLESLVETELRGDETQNPDVAAEEGMTWVPPVDPPVIADREAPGGVAVASGFGVDALEEPYDADHHSELLSVEDEVVDRVREALRADSATSTLADSIIIGAVGGRVVLRGTVADLSDTDEAVAVAERVTGVVEVVDELEVEALDR
jgi:BON domain